MGKRGRKPVGPRVKYTVDLPEETLKRAKQKHDKLHSKVVGYITDLSNTNENDMTRIRMKSTTPRRNGWTEKEISSAESYYAGSDHETEPEKWNHVALMMKTTDHPHRSPGAYRVKLMTVWRDRHPQKDKF